MDEQDIKKILQIIFNNLHDKEFIWRLEGSANLRIQGVDVSARDLDITTNEDGIKIFRNSLEKFIVKDFFNEKINGWSIVCNINDFEVEINSFCNEELNMFDKTEIILWNGMQIPILPLKNAKKFYEIIKRKEKVELIEKYLSN